MAKSNYSELLKSPHWQKKRLIIMSRDKLKCKKCGDSETTLHVHHKLYINGLKPWEYENNQLITLCEDCHCFIEQYKEEIGEDLNDLKILKCNTFTDIRFRVIFASLHYELYTMTFSGDDKKSVSFGYENTRKLEKLLK